MRFAASITVALVLGTVHGLDAIGPAQPGQAQAPQSSAAQTTVTPPAPAGPQVNAKGAATKAFLDRIGEYADFHNNVERMVPPLKETANPQEIAARETALGSALIKQRPDAKEGDFFITQYRPFLIQIIKDDFAKRAMADRKALIVELPKDIKMAVNMVYPTTLPLATLPANLLRALPELPKEVEYRIVGRHLILRDTTGNVVVDLMRDVFPIPK